MSSVRKAVGVLLAAMVSFGLMALPAAAGVETGTITIVGGQARVGSQIDSDRIPNDGECEPSGKGLNAPTFGDGAQTKQRDKTFGFQVNKEVFYRLDIPAPGSTDFAEVVIVDTNHPEESGAYAGELNVCGIVSPGAAGIGAACGSSTGRDGKGALVATNVADPDIVRHYAIQNASWVTAVGGMLPVYGHITRVDPSLKATKFTAKGTFQGLVNADGAGPCLEPKPGARSFRINGVVVSEALGKDPKPRPTKLKKSGDDD